MQTTSKSIFLTLLLTLIAAFKVQGQIAISNIEELSKIKGGTTYVVMQDPDAEASKPFVDVFKANWTISKLKFIKSEALKEHIAPENSFVTVTFYEKVTQRTRTNSKGEMSQGMQVSTMYFYLELWTCSPKYFVKNRKRDFEQKDRVQVARIDFYTDFETIQNPYKINKYDYDGEGHIHNWGPGILKNYLQTMMSLLKKGQERKINDEILNIREVKKLKKEILYVPDYTLIKFNKFNGKEDKRHEEKELFEDYPYKYKLVSREELNKKILEDNTGFYYFIYVKTGADKSICVINSLTGEIIYSKNTALSYNIKSKDFKELRKEIE
jgi:hypothetical protein